MSPAPRQIRNRLAMPPRFGIDGRLGNQLWQIASLYGIAMSEGRTPAIPHDWPYRHVWQLPDHWFTIRRRLDQIPNVLEHPATAHLPLAFRQYLQDRSFWWEYRGTMRDRFLNWSDEAEGILAPIADRQLEDLPGPVLAVHVRRQDNVTNAPGTINLVGLDYYQRALAEFRGVAAAVAVFSDDPGWCAVHLDEFAKALDGVPARVVTGGPPRPKEHLPEFHTAPVLDWVDLLLMAWPTVEWCGHVLSNSTYAWWGAFLADSKRERVLYPSYWVGEHLRADGFDPALLFPPDWEQIDAEGVEP